MGAADTVYEAWNGGVPWTLNTLTLCPGAWRLGWRAVRCSVYSRGLCLPARSCRNRRCKSGFTNCDGRCYDLDNEEAHCGSCNHSCVGRATCQNGSCIAPGFDFVTEWGTRGSATGEFKYPSGLALSPLGFVYVTDLDNDRVQVFDESGGLIGWWGSSGDQDSQFTHPLRVALAPDDSVYVTDGSDRVQRFDMGGNFQLGWDGSVGAGAFGNPRGIAIDADINVFVADTENHRIQVFDADGDFLFSFGGSGNGDGAFNLPAGMAFDASGNLLVADSFNHRVQTFAPDGHFLSAFGSFGADEGELDFPQSVAVAPSGDIFVADSGNDRIQQFDATGAFVLAFGSSGSDPGEFNFPEGVVVAANGDLYVADTGNDRIQKFAPN
jgi:DNA-binding beta-propeller fold protein YncE